MVSTELEHLDLKVRITREADSMIWNMHRCLYPIMSLLLQTDFDLYKKYELQEQFRRIRNLHKQLEDDVRALRDELTERRQRAAGVSSDD